MTCRQLRCCRSPCNSVSGVLYFRLMAEAQTIWVVTILITHIRGLISPTYDYPVQSLKVVWNWGSQGVHGFHFAGLLSSGPGLQQPQTLHL